MFADLHSLEPGEHRLTCPSCGRGPKDKTFGVTVDRAGAAVGHCYRCEHVENHWPDRAPAYRPGKAVVRPVAALKREILSDHGRELFDACCTALRGTIGEAYLQARGCVIPPADGDLRFHPALRHPSGYVGAALVALLTDASDYRIRRSLHFTWIRPDGTKAPVDPPRRLLAGHRKAGAVCRLWPDESVAYGLAVAEGIETCLSMAHAFTPVWSCIDASNLATFPTLDGVESLSIAADHDDAGLAAANACARRWSAAGREVRVVCAPGAGEDMNDLVMESA